MSNINDITPLSDLLATSPHQSSRESSALPESSDVERSKDDDLDSDGVSNAPQLRLELAFRNGISKNENETTQTEEATEKETAETNQRSVSNEHNGSEVSKTEPSKHILDETEFRNVLSSQHSKLNLVDQRNSLLKERSSLKNSIDETKLQLKYLRDLKQQRLLKVRLDELLDQSNKDATISAPGSISAVDDTDHIIKNLNVLPSTDWQERLLLIKKFYPYLELDKIETKNSYNEENKLIRTIQFQLISPLLFRIPIKIIIDNSNDSVMKTQITDWTHFQKLSKGTSQSLTTLNLLSPSFKSTLMKNYIPNNKVNLIIYGLSSLSTLLHKRISILYKLIRKYNKNVANVEKFHKLLQPEELKDNIIMFSILKSISSVEFTMQKDDSNYVVTLNWDVIVRDTVLGECESKLSLHIQKQDTTASSTERIEVNDLFLGLIEEYGVISSFAIVMKNTFKM